MNGQIALRTDAALPDYCKEYFIVISAIKEKRIADSKPLRLHRACGNQRIGKNVHAFTNIRKVHHIRIQYTLGQTVDLVSVLLSPGGSIASLPDRQNSSRRNSPFLDILNISVNTQSDDAFVKRTGSNNRNIRSSN